MAREALRNGGGDGLTAAGEDAAGRSDAA